MKVSVAFIQGCWTLFHSQPVPGRRQAVGTLCPPSLPVRQKEQHEHPKEILVVGGVAGGASCAARARRFSEDAEIIVFERGPYVSFANCGLPYYIGDVIQREDKLLVATAEPR